MTHTPLITRRTFLKFFGMAASVTVLQACTPQIEPDESSLDSSIPVKPTQEESKIKPATATVTDYPIVIEALFPEVVLAEASTFQMGSSEGYSHEQPVHKVTLTKPFYIGIYAVTYEEYDRYSEDTQKSYLEDQGQGRGNRPVSGVDWYDAVAYCNWLSEKAGLTTCYSSGGKVTKCDFDADGYRLPTEAEWEYAARGGQNSQGFLYAGSNDPDEVGWYAGNSGGMAHPVGQKKPNELGIYDMSGNRWEWCWDWYAADYYATSPDTDPTGPTKVPKGSFVERSRRSSSAVEDAATLRTSYRSADGVTYPGDNGLRLVRTA